MADPLSDDVLAVLFTVNQQGRLVARESTTLELKENFNWGNRDQYAKTMAAYANNRGGYIFFGIKNAPHDLIGMTNDNFVNFDPAKCTEFLNECLSPAIYIEQKTYELGGKKFGVLYIHEASVKPVICTRNYGDALKDGDVYYRYGGRSQRIRSSELQSVLEHERHKQIDGLLTKMAEVGKIGVDAAAILDTDTGELKYGEGRVIVDEKLLDKVKFIKEGQFHEVEGTPTLKIVGEAEGAHLVMHEAAVPLHAPDIVRAFLAGTMPEGVTARDVLAHLPFEASSYLPVFYYAAHAGMNRPQLLALLKKSEATTGTKANLIERITKYPTCLEVGSLRANAGQKATNRLLALEGLLDGHAGLEGLEDEDNVLRLLEAFTHLSKEQIGERRVYLFGLIGGIYEKYFQGVASLRFPIYRAMCHLDEALYGEP